MHESSWNFGPSFKDFFLIFRFDKNEKIWPHFNRGINDRNFFWPASTLQRETTLGARDRSLHFTKYKEVRKVNLFQKAWRDTSLRNFKVIIVLRAKGLNWDLKFIYILMKLEKTRLMLNLLGKRIMNVRFLLIFSWRKYSKYYKSQNFGSNLPDRPLRNYSFFSLFLIRKYVFFYT
jgi:hypothetical protein